MLGTCQHRSMKLTSCLTYLIVFYDVRIGCVDEEKLDVYLDFSKAFSHDILIDKLMKYGLNGLTLRWAENWLNSGTQRVEISSTEPSWRAVTGDGPQGSIHV